MSAKPGPYFPATRHPLPCFVFLLPLLLAYEGGVLWLGGAQAETLRNGADAWARWALEGIGLRQLYWAPAILGGVFLIASWVRRKDRPLDVLGVTTGMAIESVIFALGLWGLSRGMQPFLEKLGVRLEVHPEMARLVGQVITFVGAGIYEEVLFRLILFSGLAWLLKWTGLPGKLAIPVAGLASAALFSAAHHVGPYGEPFDRAVFAFRMMAGIYFAILFQLRGFGIAVGAHAVYDIVVGVTLG